MPRHRPDPGNFQLRGRTYTGLMIDERVDDGRRSASEREALRAAQNQLRNMNPHDVATFQGVPMRWDESFEQAISDTLPNTAPGAINYAAARTHEDVVDSTDYIQRAIRALQGDNEHRARLRAMAQAQAQMNTIEQRYQEAMRQRLMARNQDLSPAGVRNLRPLSLAELAARYPQPTEPEAFIDIEPEVEDVKPS